MGDLGVCGVLLEAAEVVRLFFALLRIIMRQQKLRPLPSIVIRLTNLILIHIDNHLTFDRLFFHWHIYLLYVIAPEI